MNKEEILKGLEDIKQLECNPEYKTKIIDGIVDLYNKEVEKNKKYKDSINKRKQWLNETAEKPLWGTDREIFELLEELEQELED